MNVRLKKLQNQTSKLISESESSTSIQERVGSPITQYTSTLTEESQSQMSTSGGPKLFGRSITSKVKSKNDKELSLLIKIN